MGDRTPKNSIFILLIFISASLFSQQSEYIKGKLLDAKSQEPIVFASIRIKDRALGIISNFDGGFKIPWKYKEYGNIIEISSMGYQSKELLISDLSIYEVNTVRLTPAVMELDEAIITVNAKKRKKLSAKQIVRKAIKAIPENYPVKPFSTVGYYRDYQRDSLQYVNLNEAILEVFDQGFAATDSITTKVKIYDYLENTDFKRDTMAMKSYNYNSKEGRKVIDKAFLSSYGGNEFTILRVHDALRNYQINSYSFVNRFKSDLLSQHKFKKVADIYLDDQAFYTIKFDKRLLDYSAYGTMYISKRNFAIHNIKYAVYDRTKNLPDGLLNKHKTKNQLIFEVISEYGEMNNKMFLNYISFHNTFKLWDPPKLVAEHIIPEFVLMCFVIKFNKKILRDDAIELKNYEIKVKGKIIPIYKVELLDSQDVVHLYPKMYPNKAEKMLREIDIAARKDKVTPELFEYKITNIKDFEGNVINEWTSRGYNQFREFFVQELKLNPKVPTDTLYMHKRKPIFKDQPIVKPDNFYDYWMNTPLQNIDN